MLRDKKKNHLLEEIAGFISTAQTVHNLAAYCIRVLTDAYPSPLVMQFISSNCTRNPDSLVPVNPDLDQLIIFSDEVIRILDERKTLGLYMIQRDRIADTCRKLRLSVTDNSAKTRAIVCYYILKAIDRCASSWFENWSDATYGPLNTLPDHEIALYLTGSARLMRHELLRNMVSVSGLNECLMNLMFIDIREWGTEKELPRIVRVEPLNLARSISWRYRESESIRIVVIPFGYGQHVQFKYRSGNCLYVDYDNSKEADVTCLLIEALERALAFMPHIVVFPEYIMTPVAFIAIKVWLDANWKNAPWAGELLAVIAGSTWTPDDNNVLFMASAMGIDLGCYYKESPYRSSVDVESPGELEVVTENLTSPGKITTLLYVDGLGALLPSICRDIVDGGFTEKLASLFHPLLVVTPAWSRSVEPFAPRYHDLANKYHATGLMCNYCGVIAHRSGDGRTIGYAISPRKDATRPSYSEFPLSCTQLPAVLKCENPCVWIVEADYAYEKVELGHILSIQQKLAQI